MGNFYTNITFRGVTQKQLIEKLTELKRVAFVAPTLNSYTTIFDAESDEEDPSVMSFLMEEITEELKCKAWGVLNHDDDAFMYQLYENGDMVDDYNSCPDNFESSGEESSGHIGGDADFLCSIMGNGENVDLVQEILEKSFEDEAGYSCEIDRHLDLVKALNMPEVSVGIGYSYLSAGEEPVGVSFNDLKKIVG